MIRKAMLPAALMAAAITCASAAHAATGSSSAAGANAAPSSAAAQPVGGSAVKSGIRYVALSDRVNLKDVAALNSSKLTLDKAIVSAESETKGKAVEARFQANPHGPQYVVWVMKNNEVMKALVDADTGKVTNAAHGIALHRLYPYERTDFVITEKAKAGLAEAVAIAEATSNAKPIAATLERSERMPAYHVVIVGSHGLETVWVSPDNPAVVASK
jgi:uncharacterized membrane protein YkoI